MLQSILKLEGTRKLTKNEQKAINGGRQPCSHDHTICWQWGLQCTNGWCVPNQ